jgi:uncharacterized protein YdeI (YjbR/CyaY-like superfamily)
MAATPPDRLAGASAGVRPELPILECASEAGWEQWLEDNHARSRGVWLKFARQGADATTVTRAEALELAICFGWIDGQSRRIDETYYVQRFTPRGRRSKWSQINREKAERLIAAGRMREAGHAHISAAQADGRWDAAYEPPSRATVPDDLREALDAQPAARAFFDTLSGMRRYAFLYRLHHVKTPEARRRRIATYIELLREGRTLE